MQKRSKDELAFLALLRAGLWEQDARILLLCEVDYAEVLRLAEEQSVVGLVFAGIEHITDTKPTKKDVLQFVGRLIQMERRNIAMNYFIAMLVGKMRNVGIHTLLVKGQGVAQCYENPQWRLPGDVDFLFDEENYQKAREFLLPLSSGSKQEERYSKHLGVDLDSWYVEIHGTMRTGLSSRVDRVVDTVQSEVFRDGKTRIWRNNSTDVLLPAPDQDVFLVFTHFIKHFYKEGVRLRQICDWCRLLWTYRSAMDVALLERWLCRAGLMEEWQTFAALAVIYLGMPVETMPLLGSEVLASGSRLSRKAKRLLSFILAGGGHHIVRYTFTLAKIFPGNTVKFLPSIFLNVNWLKVKERFLLF